MTIGALTDLQHAPFEAAGSVVPRASAMALGFGGPTLALEAPVLGAASRASRSPDGVGCHSSTQDIGEPLSRGSSVAQLRAMLLGADGQYGPGDPRRQFGQHPFALDLIQGCRGAEIKTQLHPGIRGVDTLAAGTGSVAELLDELSRRHREAVRCTGARGNTQVIHPTSLSQCVAR